MGLSIHRSHLLMRQCVGERFAGSAAAHSKLNLPWGDPMAIVMNSRRFIRPNCLGEDIMRLSFAGKIVLQLARNYHVVRAVMILKKQDIGPVGRENVEAPITEVQLPVTS